MSVLEKKDRNKDVIQLFKVGWSRYSLAKLFGMDRANTKRLIVRDFDKYPSPTLDELRDIESRYNIKIGEVKNVESPLVHTISSKGFEYQEKKDRNNQIVEMSKSQTISEIARQMKITRSRVKQIINKYTKVNL